MENVFIVIRLAVQPPLHGPAEDGALTVDVRGRQIEAKFVPLPFYQRKK